MSDYRDQFERKLVQASERLTRDALAKPQRLRVVSRRALPYAVVGFLCAGTAVAATGTRPWSPLLGDPTQPESAPTATISSPPRSQLDALGALRRPATTTDHGAAVTASLEFLGPATTGIRTAHIRRVGTTAIGAPAIMIPAERWKRGDGLTINDPVCLVLTDPMGNAAAKNCWSTRDIQRGEASGSYGSAIYGLVPDGVARVVATHAQATAGDSHPAAGDRISAPVVNNFFTIGGAADQVDGGGVIPVRPKRLDGLDAAGKRVLKLRP